MASGIFYPAVSGDDGYWYGGSYKATEQYVIAGNMFDTPNHTFLRFLNVVIPQGSTISSAFIRLTALDFTQSSTPVNLEVYFNDIDDAVAPISTTEANGLALTSAISWTISTSWLSDVQYDTPELKTILQAIIDRGGWSSNNSIQALVKEVNSAGYVYRQIRAFDYDSGSKKAELHITWEETPSIEGELDENVNVLSEFDDNFGELNENVNVLSEFDNNWPELDENINVTSEFEVLGSDGISEEISVNSEIEGEHVGFFSENASINSELISEHTGELSEEASVNSDFAVARHLTIQDTLSSWDTLKWGWNKTILDSLSIVDTASKILGIPVKEWLTLTDTETTNWNGVESISDSLYIVDILKVVNIYNDLIADGMAITDAVKIALELVITDILTCVDTLVSTWAGSRSVSSSFSISDTTSLIKIYNDLIADGIATVDAASLALELVIADKLKVVDSVQNIGVFQHLLEDGMTLEDIAKRFFPKSVSDSFAIADTSLVDFLALLQISDSFSAVDTATRLLTINQLISDALEALDTVSVQQLIQELIQDGLNIEVSVVIDGEIWECFVLNTSSFHPSVYSNYEFNSFAIDRSNNICYGCKSDGIYTLEGNTDDGTAIRAGIILPKTDFGLMNKKRMRKAWLAVDDDNLILKLETESGDKTFKMTDAECSLTRSLKGRRWTISVEGFESMDSLNLVPVILSRK